MIMRKPHKIKLFILLNLLIFFATPAVAQLDTLENVSIGEWDRYVRKFRRDHHLSVLTSYDRGTWKVGRFGDIVNENFASEVIDMEIQYTFHIQILGRFGYSLGTSGGYFYERLGKKSDQFSPSSGWKLPGLVAEVVYNLDASARIFSGCEFYLTRLNNIGTRYRDGSADQAALTAETYEFHTGVDWFYVLNSGIKFFYYERLMWIPKPQDASGYLSDARLSRTSRGAGIGVIYHFL